MILAGADGTWHEFDDRSLLNKVLPALDLKTVLELILAPLDFLKNNAAGMFAHISVLGNGNGKKNFLVFPGLEGD